MTDYSGLVKALRGTDFGDACDYCEHSDMCKDDDCIILQAAAAIEELQAEVAELKRVNMEIFEDLPKRGEWKYIVYHNGCTPDEDIVCSVCGKSGLDNWNYCPNCGSLMRGDVNERR